MFSSLQRVLSALKAGKIVALYDDCSPVPSVSLLRDAAGITAEDVTFFARYGRGVVCAAITEERRVELGLPLMATQTVKADDSRQFQLTVSIEARRGVTTGISAADRAATLRTLAATQDSRHDLVTPGHIFPARAQKGGTLVRAALPEACIDLLQLARLEPAAAFVQCLGESGGFLSDPERAALLKDHGIPEVPLSEIIRYRLAHESLIARVAEAKLPTHIAEGYRAICYHSQVDGAEHLALVHGEPSLALPNGEPETVLVRVQAESPFSDLFGIVSGRGLESLRSSLKVIARHGPGVLVYIRHPRRELLQRTAFETLSLENRAEQSPAAGGVQALRELGVGAQILSDLGVRRAIILSNAQRDFSALSAFRIDVVGQQPFPRDESAMQSLGQ